MAAESETSSTSDATADGAAAAVAAELSNHAIIAGFGVPGRAVAEWMTRNRIPFVVIEQNPAIVDRCSSVGVTIIRGNASDEAALRAAGVERAAMLALALPIEPTVLEAVPLARRLNPNLRIIARCAYISGGMEAIRRGADEAIVAEEIAAREFVRLLDGGQTTIHASPQAHTPMQPAEGHNRVGG